MRVVTTTLPVAHKIDNIQYHYPGTDLGRIRTRAMGALIQARDLMLMNHLQEALQTFDIADQVIQL